MHESHDTLNPKWFDTHRYALIDAVWRNDLPASWPSTVVAPPQLGSDTARCPVLLDMHALAPEALGELMGHLAQQVRDHQDALCSLLLRSDAQPPALAIHLARRMVLELPGQTEPKQLRYFDPGTFLQLPRLLGDTGMAWLLGPCASAWVPWAGAWTRVTTPATRVSHLRWGKEHIHALSRLGAVNRVAMQLLPPAKANEWELRCAAIDDHVQRAIAEHGLTQQADVVAFATHAMQHHPDFDQHPRLRAIFHTLNAADSEDELDYRELTSRLSAADWNEVRQAMPSHPAVPLPRQGHPV